VVVCDLHVACKGGGRKCVVYLGEGVYVSVMGEEV